MSRYNDRKCYVYGFEDHTMYVVGSWFLKGEEASVGSCYGSNRVYYPLYNKEQDNFNIIDHKELLDTAEKVYVHPSCKLSRTMLSAKYKKSLNPWLSDVVVVPDTNKILSKEPMMLFVNEDKKIMVLIFMPYSDAETISAASKIKPGTTLRDLGNLHLSISYRDVKYSLDDYYDCALLYYGDFYTFYGEDMYMLDVLTSMIPQNKTVFESSIQKTLGSDENKLTCDNLISISEMLDSTDENTVSAGLKALSMMDWMHYPESIKVMLQSISYYKWYYNKTRSSTSVKYMLNQIFDSVRSAKYGGGFSKKIYEDDFSLFKDFVSWKYKYDESQLNDYLRYLPFMKLCSDGVLRPNLRK